MKQYDQKGKVIDFSGTPIYNNLEIAERFMEAMPEGQAFAIFAIPAENGNPRLVLVNPTLIATSAEVTKEIVQNVNEARQGLVDANDALNAKQDASIAAIRVIQEAMLAMDRIQTQDIENLRQAQEAIKTINTRQDGSLATLEAMQKSMSDLLAQLALRKQVVVLPDVVIPPADLVTLLATEKTFTKACTGVLTTDVLLVTPKNLPANYGLRSWSVPSKDNVAIKVQCPILSLAGSGTAITFGVTAIR